MDDTPRILAAGPILQTVRVDDLLAALATFQSSVDGASKGGTNPHFRARYTRLEDAWRAARAPLTAAGLSVSQWPGDASGGSVSVTTRLGHSSGQWMQTTHTLPVDTAGSKNPAQAVGSTLTYLQRYALLAILGLPPEDDDAQAAGHSKPAAKKRAGPKEQAAPAADVKQLEAELRKATTELEYRSACAAIADRRDLSSSQLAALRTLARTIAQEASWHTAPVTASDK